MAKKRKKSKITILRRIVRDRQAEKVQGKMVDMQTANMLVTVYDHLKPKNQALFGALDIKTMVGMGWEVLKRSKKKK